MKLYYMKQRGKSEYGPVSLPELKALVTEGKLKAKDFVRAENGEWWETLENCKNLKPVLEMKDQLSGRFSSLADLEPTPGHGPIIGIDFGTTKTMVAEYDPVKTFAKVRKMGRGGDEMPSSIYVTDGGEVLFGDDADDEGIHDSPNHIRRFKMLLGKTTKTNFGRKSAKPTDLAAEFLAHIRSRLESEVCHRAVEQVVLTVPAMFGQAQRKDLMKAAERAGFKRVELLPEPVAAGIAYCNHHTDLSKNLRFLVVDWGGGTFDLAVVERNGADECKVLQYVGGADDIGGEDLDDELWIAVSNMIEDLGFQSLAFQPKHELGKYRRDLTRAKEGLSAKAQVTTSFTLDGGKLVRVPIDRSKLEEVIHEKVYQGAGLVAELVKRCRDSGCNLDFILLAGGTSRIPMISSLLEQTAGLPCRTWSEGRDAIALGAALHAHSLWGEVEQAEDSRKVVSTDEIVDDPSIDPAIHCPLCESSVEGISAPGNWQCPECGGEFIVACACPECGLEVEVEEWGNYSCPSKACSCEFNAADCVTVSLPAGLANCPHCGNLIERVTGTGDWTCPSCEEDFEVGCACPECGLEIEVEEWGTYSCPSKACRCEFDAWECTLIAGKSGTTTGQDEYADPSISKLSLELEESPICLQVLAVAPQAHQDIDHEALVKQTHFPVTYLLTITNHGKGKIQSVRLSMTASGGISHSILIPEITPGPEGALSLSTSDLQGWVIEPGDQFSADAVGIDPVKLKVTDKICNNIDRKKALGAQIPCEIFVRKATMTSNFVLRIVNITEGTLCLSKGEGVSCPAGSLNCDIKIGPGREGEIGFLELSGSRNLRSGESFILHVTGYRKIEGIVSQEKLKGMSGALAILGGLGALAAALAGG